MKEFFVKYVSLFSG